MVGPSVTAEDRERFVRRLKVGVALLVGLSMGLVTVYSGATLTVVATTTLGSTLVGGVLAWFTIPDSVGGIALTDPDTVDRGPKPGAQLRERERESEPERPRAVDGNGRSPEE